MSAERRAVRGFRRYPKYKDSGVEWLGEIPTGWNVRRLKYVAPAVDVRGDNKDLRYVGLENIESGTGRLLGEADQDPSEQAVETAASVFAPDDVLFGKLRPYLAKVLRVDFEGQCSTELLVLRTRGEVIPKLLAYQLRSNGFIGWINGLTYGTKMPRANPSQVLDVPVALAPAREQAAIAAFLDRETSRIDALVAKKERLIELLQEKRKALITRAVTKGLGPKVPMKDSGIDWLVETPSHWDVERIKWVARMESGHTPDKKVDSYWLGGDIPWISLADTSRLREVDVIAETAVQTTLEGITHSSARILPAGTVVFSRDATVGLCAIIGDGMAVSQHFIGWVCGPRLQPEYLLFVLRSMTQQLERVTMGATVRTIGMVDVKNLVTPIPPPDEQAHIVMFVREHRAALDTLIMKVRGASDLLKELRTALISAAVTGKIDVREEVT